MPIENYTIRWADTTLSRNLYEDFLTEYANVVPHDEFVYSPLPEWCGNTSWCSISDDYLKDPITAIKKYKKRKLKCICKKCWLYKEKINK